MVQLSIQQAYELACRHHQAGRLAEAERLYRKILAQEHEHADSLYHLGIIAGQCGQTDDGLELIRRALHVKPNYPEALNDMGEMLMQKGQIDEAVSAYHQALAVAPHLGQIHNNLATALKEKGELDKSIAGFRHAITLNPELHVAHSNLIFTMLYHPGHDPRAVYEEARRWNLRHADHLKRFIQPYTNDANPDRPLRIGYVSSDFWAHASACFLVPLFEHHDPRQVKLYCYSQSFYKPDATTRRLQQSVSNWRNTNGLSDEVVAAQIRQDGIDILVDLKVHTGHNRLQVFARKPAPVQVTWLGYPGTTGLDTIDYRLSDPYLDPPGMDESVYSEKTIRLPDTFWCYDPLEGREIPVNPLPAIERGFVTFGCLNNISKLNDHVLTTWAHVLRQVKGSRLLLLARQGDHRQRVTEFLSRLGVEPERVEFLDRQARKEYLEFYHRIDVSLDCFPYNGHTTSLDSLWMGVPVITLVGERAVSRAGWCLLSNLGLTELAGQTPEQYVQIAVDLAQDLPRLKELRSALRPRMEQSPLMNAPRFAGNIEAAFRRMWRTWCQSAAPGQ